MRCDGSYPFDHRPHEDGQWVYLTRLTEVQAAGLAGEPVDIHNKEYGLLAVPTYQYDLNLYLERRQASRILRFSDRPWFGAVALYRHDGEIWLIQYQPRPVRQ